MWACEGGEHDIGILGGPSSKQDRLSDYERVRENAWRTDVLNGWRESLSKNKNKKNRKNVNLDGAKNQPLQLVMMLTGMVARAELADLACTAWETA